MVVSAAGRPAWIAADLIAQAEHDPDARAMLLTPSRRLAAAVARAILEQVPADGPARQALAANGGIVLTRTLAEAIALCQRMAPEHVVCDTDAVAARLTRAGTIFVGDYSAQASGDYATGSNHVLPTSGAARSRGGLSAADFVRVSTVQRLSCRRPPPDRSRSDCARARRGTQRARGLDRDSRHSRGTPVSFEYERVLTPQSGLRLHLNENTAGCSPAVIEAMQALTRHDVAIYPDYSAAIEACALRLGVGDESLLLTNGLDEGILAVAVAALRNGPSASPFEAIVVVPAFDMYAACSDAAGGRVVEVPLEAAFAFPLDRVLEAVTTRTRVIWLTNPNNPTGQMIPPDAIATIAAAVPDALVMVDEAYADFSGGTLIGSTIPASHANVVVGRTFAKAYGLAGLRVGRSWSAIRARSHRFAGSSRRTASTRALPPFCRRRSPIPPITTGISPRSCNRRRCCTTAFDRLGISYWESSANFVLARFERDSATLVRELSERGVHVRDRSRDAGCAGCLRITAGVVEHTQAFIAALGELL